MTQVLQTLQANAAWLWFLYAIGAALVFFIYYARGEARKLALKLAALIIGFVKEELGKVTKEEVDAAAAEFYKKYLPAALKPFISLATFQGWTWLAFCWLRDNLTVPEKKAEIAFLLVKIAKPRRGKLPA
jgi:hypothetical protein